ncbi:MAG: hypothetical protein K9W43_08030 [Candidatus Thorarchaeota archaeon]|nr:hypothetical protein [Candidatus Thorarchaeota archaeon]
MRRDRKFEMEMLKSSEPRTVLSLIRTIEAEKRTHLAELRTGIGILTIPMSLVTILIATSKYYDILQVIPMVILLTMGIIVLLALGSYLAFQALMKLRENERFIYKVHNTASESFCDDLAEEEMRKDGAPGEI